MQCSFYHLCSQERKEKAPSSFSPSHGNPFCSQPLDLFLSFCLQLQTKGAVCKGSPPRPGRGRGQAPCRPQRRGAGRQAESGLPSRADCKGPHFLKQQRSLPPPCPQRWTRRSRPLPDLRAGPQQAGLPSRRLSLSHVSADGSESAGGEHAFLQACLAAQLGVPGPGARSNPHQCAHFSIIFRENVNSKGPGSQRKCV